MAAGMSSDQVDNLFNALASRFDERYSRNTRQVPADDGALNQNVPNGRAQFRPDEIGYFDPHLSSEFGEGDMVQVGKDTMYRNVHLFISRAKSIAQSKEPEGPNLVRRSLEQCLRGAALMWHTHELSELEQDALRGLGTGLERWEAMLLKRFKELRSVALQRLMGEKYTTNDAKHRKEPTAYVQSVLSHARASGIDNVLNQLDMAWTNLDAEVQRDIPEPTERTTVTEFQSQLERMKPVWFRIYGKSSHSGPTNTSQSGQGAANSSNRRDGRFGDNRIGTSGRFHSNLPRYGTGFPSGSNSWGYNSYRPNFPSYQFPPFRNFSGNDYSNSPNAYQRPPFQSAFPSHQRDSNAPLFDQLNNSQPSRPLPYRTPLQLTQSAATGNQGRPSGQKFTTNSRNTRPGQSYRRPALPAYQAQPTEPTEGEYALQYPDNAFNHPGETNYNSGQV